MLMCNRRATAPIAESIKLEHGCKMIYACVPLLFGLGKWMFMFQLCGLYSSVQSVPIVQQSFSLEPSKHSSG